MAENTYTIAEEANEFDDHFLDVVGGSFSFDHVKGLSEWVKNSVDAYIRSNVADKNQYIYLRFTDNRGASTIECIDFNGMTNVDIEKALKRWGDPAASKGGRKNLKTFGGHGNGGKFYMRQMFEVSQYITFKNGKLNVFGFNENRKYGFAEGFRDKDISPSEALKFAGLEKGYISSSVIDSVLRNETGFTVVRGVKPAGMPNMLKVKQIVADISNHPQSQRILSRIPAKVIHNDKVYVDRIKTIELKPMKDFEFIEPIEVPDELLYETHSTREIIKLADEKYGKGVLRLNTSEVPLAKNGKYGELNRIDVIGEIGVLASYKVHELPGHSLPKEEFIYGELEVPILEKPGYDDCVQNDRTKLTENPTTIALLDWVHTQVIELCKKISDKERQEREDRLKDVSSSLNNFLNDWKDKFMSKILSEVLIGTGPRSGQGTGGTSGGGGGSTTGGRDGGGSGGGDGDGGGSGDGDGGTGTQDDKGGGDTPKKTKRAPRVLLSDHDPDPLSPTGESLNLSPRQPAVYQRPMDTSEGIYWINTSAPLARSILDRYDQNDPRWRDYLFQRYVDIFVREALEVLEKNDPGEFNAPNVEQKINEVITRIHEAAANELSAFLFEDSFTVE